MADNNLVQITPSELTFKFELRKPIPVVLQLANPSGTRIAFKVKTTAPKKYVVRPSSGIIEPKGVKDVQVILQAQREPPSSYAECRDKFLVQCVPVDNGVTDVAAGLFDAANAAQIRQTKLRVVMLPPTKPPSPVPEGNESEPTSPPGTFRNVSEDKTAIQQQLNNTLADVDTRLASLNTAAAPSRITTTTTTTKQVAAPRSGFGVLTLLLVALLAFVLGQLSQDTMSVMVEKVMELKAQYLK